MLPGAARLTRRGDFTLAVRQGRRAGRGALVVHLFRPADSTGLTGASRRVGPAGPAGPVEAAGAGGAAGRVPPARVGFVVGRSVGGSVDRHRVVRRLRHLVRDRLDQLPAGALVVVRALPAARDADSAALGSDLDAALRRVLSRPAEAAGVRVAAPNGAGSGVPPAQPTPRAQPTPPVATP